jgi:glycosyltransferase involved in cell wall biosynthesis
MTTAPFTLIIPTIGIPELFDALRSVAAKTVRPEQVVVVIDDKGRSLSALPGSLAELEAQIQAVLPCEVLHNTHTDDWQMNNQTFNIGIAHARHEYVYVTHDDVTYPDGEYFQQVADAVLAMKAAAPPKRVAGCVFPAFHTEIAVTAPNFGASGLTQYYSAVSSLLSVAFWEEVGRFDVRHGIWWDAQMQGEFWKRDCWMYYAPLPPVTHLMNRALRATGHSHGWTKAPLWHDCAGAYERVYGKPHLLWDEWYNRPDTFIALST